MLSGFKVNSKKQKLVMTNEVGHGLAPRKKVLKKVNKYVARSIDKLGACIK